MNIYIWSSYISPRVIHGFEREYHCHVNYDLYDSNEASADEARGRQRGLRLWWSPAITWWRFSCAKACGPAGKQRLPNVWANTDPRFLGLSFDPHNEYSVPYAWGTTGLAYRADLVKANIDSWDALF